jgi:hypothetical protein
MILVKMLRKAMADNAMTEIYFGKTGGFVGKWSSQVGEKSPVNDRA